MAGNQGGGSAPRVTPPAKPQSAAPSGAVAPAAAAARPQRIKVRAKKLGYYDNLRRRPGDVFVVKESEFSERWMERVPASTPEKTTTVNEAMRREHSNIVLGKSPQLQPNAADLVPEDETEAGAGDPGTKGDEVL